jgi:hydrogenase nickel incorporation protein HypB
MCATCGCSGTLGADAAAALAGGDRHDLPARKDEHSHERGPDQARAHDHGHPHEHSQAHDDGHEHGHVHDHGHAHEHSHQQDDGDVHSHRHPHDHSHAHDHGHADGHAPGDSTAARTVQLEQEILGKNQLLAEKNRGWLEGREIFAVNLMSSPGSGKTTLLERTVRDLGKEVVVSVIEGDQETRLDAERIRGAGARVVQINTGTGCHLDAQMLGRALQQLTPAQGSLLFVENVGNLVCPALFDLGEGARVVIASTTEGEDKPLKYPHMFRAAGLVLLNKVDLLPHLSFDVARFIAHLRLVNPRAKVLEVSATRGDGLSEWYRWLAARGPSARA